MQTVEISAAGELSPMLVATPMVGDEQLELLQMKTLQRLLGSVSRWQRMWCALLSIHQAICTFHIFVYVFQVSDPQSQDLTLAI